MSAADAIHQIERLAEAVMKRAIGTLVSYTSQCQHIKVVVRIDPLGDFRPVSYNLIFVHCENDKHWIGEGRHYMNDGGRKALWVLEGVWRTKQNAKAKQRQHSNIEQLMKKIQ